MSQENVHVKADARGDRDALAEPADTDHDKRVRMWVNWALALLTVVGAGVVMVFALGAVMSTAACSDKACPNLGPNGISFDMLFYGAPVVAAVAVVASFFTARRRWGFVIPRDCDGAADRRRRHPRHHGRAVALGAKNRVTGRVLDGVVPPVRRPGPIGAEFRAAAEVPPG